MSCGANFASSPARVLIDFVDPLIVAEKVATTEKQRYITINEIATDLRDRFKWNWWYGSNGEKDNKIGIKWECYMHVTQL